MLSKTFLNWNIKSRAHTLLKKNLPTPDKIFALLCKYMKFIKNIKDAEKFFSSEGTGYLLSCTSFFIEATTLNNLNAL